MVETGETLNPQTTFEAEKNSFSQLHERAVETRVQLGHQVGIHVFAVDHPRYSLIELAANSHKHDAVVMHEKPADVADAVGGGNYRLQRRHTISWQPDGKLKYYASDQMLYKHGQIEDWETELDTVEAEHDFTSPLPERIAGLLSDIESILPTITNDQYQAEQSEEWEEETASVAQLEALNELLDTPTSALRLLQMAVLDQYHRATDKTNDKNFVMTRSGYRFDRIVTYHDVLPDDTSQWYPDIVVGELKTFGGFRTFNGVLDHTRLFLISDNKDGGFRLEVSETFGTGQLDSTIIDTFVQDFGSDEVVPDKVKSIFKSLLLAIVDSSAT